MSRILVIDDCDEFREIVGDLLADIGHEVVLVSGPEEAKQHWMADQFQVVMCDLVMPLADEEGVGEDSESAMVGVHTIHEISRSFPGVPVIAVSGKLVGEPLQAVSSFGAFATLSKPFSRDELVAVLDHALANRGLAAEH